MTEEDKKEFEEFLEWKKQKKAKESEEKTKDLPQSAESQVIQSVADDKSSQNEESINKPDESSKRDDNSTNTFLVILGFVIVIIIALIFAIALGNNSSNPNASTAYADSTEVDTLTEFADSLSGYADDTSGSPEGWTRSEETDPMNDSKSVFVSVTSDNSNKLDFPYGDAYVTLTVRRMKKYGVDVLVKSSSGQIYGSEYNGDNYVTIRFDSNKPMRFYFDTSSDGSSDVVFLRKRTAFIQAAKKAHEITVEVPYYQGGRQVFYFTTPDPLEW